MELINPQLLYSVAPDARDVPSAPVIQPKRPPQPSQNPPTHKPNQSATVITPQRRPCHRVAHPVQRGSEAKNIALVFNILVLALSSQGLYLKLVYLF